MKNKRYSEEEKPAEFHPDVERRFFKLTDMKLEKREKEELPKITGYAAVFNKMSVDMGFRERIAPGAFKGALKISDARALYNHNPDYVLGRQSAGTLTLREDDKGLWMEVTPPNTSYARDLLENIRLKNIKEQSFGFTVKSDSWDDIESDTPTRTLLEIGEVFDASVVTYPAYQDTTVALRSLERAKAGVEPEIDTTTLQSVPGVDWKWLKETYIRIATQEKLSEETEEKFRRELNRLLEVFPSVEPMQDDGEKETVEPMQDKEDRDASKEVDEKFKKHGMEIFA